MMLADCWFKKGEAAILKRLLAFKWMVILKLLLKAALQNRRHLVILSVTVIAMIFFTFASQLEGLALAIITKKGPDFFELFAPMKDGQLVKSTAISKEQFEERWTQLDASGDNVVTLDNTIAFMDVHGTDRVSKAIDYANNWFHFDEGVANLAIFLIFVALLKAVSQFCHRYSTRLIAIRVSRDLRQSYFEHLQSLPMEFYQKHDIGGLSTRAVGDAGVIAEALTATLINYFQSPFVILTSLIWCFLTSWQLTLLVFVGLPFLAAPIFLIARQVKKISRQIQKNQEGFAAVLIDFFAGIQTVKVFAMEDFSLKKYREQNERLAYLEQKGARYDLSSRPIVHTIGVLCIASVMLFGMHVLQMSVTSILLYCALLYLLYEPIKKFAEENNQIQRGIAAAERMYEVMSITPRIQDDPNAETFNSFEDTIEFDNIWFRYADKWILKGLSFTVKKGETIALVGPTGAGKSTIVQLLPRLYDVEKGEIRIDGKPLKNYTQRSLRDQIAFVPQKPFLFMDTVAENIAFGRPFSRDKVHIAAKRAYADEFVTQLTEGYDTYLAEAGKNLSGGQQQRLAIARALVKDAPILVLDEATSSLDNLSEIRIKQALIDLHGTMTQIIIAHRLSTIEDADRIIYIEEGVKIAEGTKDELLATCLPFRALWEARHKPELTEALVP
ncbi:MAG: ABC transporter ATP-binding protein [Chlamydiales bacterium]|nr:ABC transporter ATP-binding protein [Chlamydiales bacterium]